MKTQKLDTPASPRASLESRQGTVTSEPNTTEVKPVENTVVSPEQPITNAKRSATNDGWVEVLFRRNQKAFRELRELVPADYELVGAPVPIKELKRPYDVYVMLHRGEFKGAPRAVAHGDILNIRITSPVNAIRTYMLLDPDLVKAKLLGGTYRLDTDPEFPLGMLLLSKKFHSFVNSGEPEALIAELYPNMETRPTNLTYEQCVERMTMYRRLQTGFIYVIILLPGLLFLDVTPVRVVSLWILGLVGFWGGHTYRVHYRELAKQIYEAK